LSQLSFEEAVERLGAFRTRGWRLGLDRMQEFLRRLGVSDKLGAPDQPGQTRTNPNTTQFIHVAGTNGKGSVCAYLQAMLHEQGYRVGATYSPYVYDVRERVQLGRDLISKQDFARLVERLLEVGATLDDTELGGPTEFEMKTALGFLYWAEKQCDWVALEVGLGGRLDATNVVDPACCVIVSVGLDHTHILGDTLAQIATEKAGIIKSGRPVVVGDLPQEAMQAVEAVARENRAPLYRYGKEFGDSPFVPGIKGHAQAHNLALAVKALELVGAVRDERRMAEGAARARLPGRFEVRQCQGRTFILDGAHNASAAAHLVATMRESGYGGRYKLVTGHLQGHDPNEFYKPLEPVVERAFVAKIDFFRAMEPQEVIAQSGLKDAKPYGSSEEALRACIAETREGETVLVTGSFYLVGEVGNLLSRAQSPAG
jgi:dihydrofolate synthase/folylpolyglutamate synthase